MYFHAFDARGIDLVYAGSMASGCVRLDYNAEAGYHTIATNKYWPLRCTCSEVTVTHLGVMVRTAPSCSPPLCTLTLPDPVTLHQGDCLHVAPAELKMKCTEIGRRT